MFRCSDVARRKSYGSFPPAVRRRVVVTGIGAVTPLGLTAVETWRNVLAGRSSGRRLADVPYFFPDFVTGEDARGRAATPTSCEKSLDRRKQILDALPCGVACPVVEEVEPKCQRFAPTQREPRSHRFCTAAAQEALADAKLVTEKLDEKSRRSTMMFDASAYPLERVAVNIGTGIPSLADVTETSHHLMGSIDGQCNYSRVHPFFVPKILGNMAASAVALQYGFLGPIGSNVSACATGAHCIGEASRWIQEGCADVAVCGATEACITPVSIAGFCRMRALSTKYNDQPECASRPFDTRRGGFVMGEGSAVLVLESLEHAMSRGARIYAELRGFGCSSDSYHVSSPHPDGVGAKRCVLAALKDSAGVQAEDIEYVNAHATGTPMGDDIELRALTEMVARGNKKCVPVSSSKGGLGHLLGAAGSIEAAISVLALFHRSAPPNVNLDDPIPHDGSLIHLNREPIDLGSGNTLGAVLSTSFGFGGVNTALIFTRAPS